MIRGFLTTHPPDPLPFGRGEGDKGGEVSQPSLIGLRLVVEGDLLARKPEEGLAEEVLRWW